MTPFAASSPLQAQQGQGGCWVRERDACTPARPRHGSHSLTLISSSACIPCLPSSSRSHVAPLRTHAHAEAVLLTPLNTTAVVPTHTAAAAAALLAACAVAITAAVTKTLHPTGDPASSNPTCPADLPGTPGSPPTTTSWPASSATLSNPQYPSADASSSALSMTTTRAASLTANSSFETRPAGSETFSQRPNTALRQHQRVVARSRQSAAVSSAVRLMRRGDETRAHAELVRALQMNSVSRVPCAPDAPDHDACLDLYLLYVRSCNGNLRLGPLLQLQEMLGIGPSEAEDIELHVLNSMSGSFTI